MTLDISKEVLVTLQILSPSFENTTEIPQKYTCDADNVAPELQWKGAPQKTQSFVLIMDDPDAPQGTWTHWVLFNIPANVQTIRENTKTIKDLPSGTQWGKTSSGSGDYHGPCPPDKRHRYFFKLYALDTTLNLDNDVDKATVEKTMAGHVLAEAILMGTYNRPRNKS